MADIDIDGAETTSSKSPLVFYKGFETRKSGDVILQADDKSAYCFYFRLSLLSALSTFFANLPPPSSTDLVDGVPLIPLIGTTSGGLAVYLSILQSTTTAAAYDWANSGETWTNLLDAAVTARMYDTPFLYRALHDCIRDDGYDGVVPYYTFAIFAIGSMKDRLSQAARDTLRATATPISLVKPSIVNMLLAHAPLAWSRLQSLHLHYLQAVPEFKRRIRNVHTAELSGHTRGLLRGTPCLETVPSVAGYVRALFEDARTAEDILAILQKKYELRCSVCLAEVRGRYSEAMAWLADFAFEFEEDE